ncbi:MAG: cation:proton antiporter, partial [Clostridia bacterium]|nr:cation:proton antiporter [Clostridia bacterium]
LPISKGPLTNLLLPIVALDDAVGLILFATSFGVAKALISGSVDIISVVVEPIIEVVGSLALGAIMGLLFTFFEKFFHSRSKRLSMSVTFVFLTVAFSMLKFEVFSIHVSFSSLLVCMMLGTVFCNACDFSEELMDRVDRWTAPLFVLFFVISGAQLELSVFTDLAIVLIGVVYIIARSAGKYFGAFTSAKATKCSNSIVKYLGITLLPQAGVALGMAIKAEQELGEYGSMIANITLFAVLIYELVGPMLTKISLLKAGEIQPEGAVSAREEARKANEHKHLGIHFHHNNPQQ